MEQTTRRKALTSMKNLELFIIEQSKEPISRIEGDEELYFQMARGVNAFYRTTEDKNKTSIDDILYLLKDISSFDDFMNHWAPKAKYLSFDQTFELSTKLRKLTPNNISISWACGYVMASIKNNIYFFFTINNTIFIIHK